MQETHCAFVFTATFCWSIAQLLSAASGWQCAISEPDHTSLLTNMLRGAHVVASTFAMNTKWALGV